MQSNRPGGNGSSSNSSKSSSNAFADLLGPSFTSSQQPPGAKALNSIGKPATATNVSMPIQPMMSSNISYRPPPQASMTAQPPMRSSSPAPSVSSTSTNYNSLNSLDPFARPASSGINPPYSIGKQPQQAFDGLGSFASPSSNNSNTLLQSIPARNGAPIQTKVATQNTQQPANALATKQKYPFDLLSFDMNARSASSNNMAKPSMNSMMRPNQTFNNNASLNNNQPPLVPQMSQVSAWDQLDVLASGKPTTSNAPATSNDIFDLEYLNKKSSTVVQENDDDILGIFSSNPQKGQPSSPATRTPATATPSKDTELKESIEKMAAMGFDSETSRRALIAANMNVDQAVSSLLNNSTSTSKPTSSPNTPVKSPTNSLVVAAQDLVKMGFEYNASISALQSCGMDKQAAIAILVSESSVKQSPSTPDHDREKVDQLVQAGFKESACRAALRSCNGDIEAAMDTLLRQNNPQQHDSFSKSSAARFDANSLVGAASQIGFSVFKNAKTAFSIAKKKVGEVLNEKGNGSGNAGAVSEREWSSANFKDSSERMEATYGDMSDGEGSNHYKPYTPQQRLSRQDSDESMDVPLERRAKPISPVVAVKSTPLATGNLLQLDGEASDNEFSNVKAAIATPSPLPSNLIPEKKKKPTNNVVATEAQIQQSNSYRASGNEFFKQGQFGDAETQYTLGIESLPAGHSDLIPLYNNRAACRLKNGDNRGAVGDCDYILQNTPDDLKALLRRATAYEALENWEKARDDYRKIMGIDSSVKGCSIGLARANAALQPKSDAPTAPTTIPGHGDVPKPMLSSVKKAVDEAVQKVRDTNEAKEQLDNEKFAASEKVEKMIEAWKNNKEANIRALLSSLDTILWPECGWKSVTLSDLISPAQVKKRYIQAVAKVHPDKLGANCTVEQQLIASSVFTVLNKAWDSFKLANNL